MCTNGLKIICQLQVFIIRKKKQTQKLSLKGLVSTLLSKRFIRVLNNMLWRLALVAVKLDGQNGNIIKLRVFTDKVFQVLANRAVDVLWQRSIHKWG